MIFEHGHPLPTLWRHNRRISNISTTLLLITRSDFPHIHKRIDDVKVWHADVCSFYNDIEIIFLDWKQLQNFTPCKSRPYLMPTEENPRGTF